jgi:uncharacterized cofD-like protein
MEELFQYRFDGESTLGGHSFGNIFILALSRVTQGFEEAVQAASKILAIRGRVVPSTLCKINLVAELEDGTTASGETNITQRKSKAPIKKLSIQPFKCDPTASAIQAIIDSDAVILGPGSLYTSIMPNLLIDSITETINNSHAVRIYVCNVMTQPGETEKYRASDHIKALYNNTKLQHINYALINRSNIPKLLAERYKLQGAYQVQADIDAVRSMGIIPVEDNFITISGAEGKEYLRHNPRKITKAILDIISIAKSEAAHK